MNLSRHSPAPTRYVGIGLVVALHLAGIYALSAGLIKPVPKAPEATVLLPNIDDSPRPLPKPEPIKAELPPLTAPTSLPIPDPIHWTDVPAQRTDTVTPTDTVPTAQGATGGGTGPVVPPTVVPSGTGITSPGAVCSVMPRPEVPAVSWTGEAVLNVVATVRGGRVVGTEVRVALGALDVKTRRSLQRAVESALAGYQCQGEAMFQQDFAFRID